MSTKAFTSALGFGITVRGYIDEDDKLVLLEPEGEGGGGDSVTLAAVTIEVPVGKSIYIPLLTDGVFNINVASGTAEHNIALINGGVVIPTDGSDAWNPENFEYTGGVSSDENWNILITGPGTMTARGQ